MCIEKIACYSYNYFLEIINNEKIGVIPKITKILPKLNLVLPEISLQEDSNLVLCN